MRATRFETEEGPRAVIAHENITRRHLMEEAIRESEGRFRLLYEQAPVAYQSLDETGRLIEVNRIWLEMLGYTREEVIGHGFVEFLAPRHRAENADESFARRFERFKQAGRVQGIEFEMLQKDGTPLIVNLDGSIGRDTQGNFIQTHCTLHNITRRRREEEARRALELRLTQQQKLESIGTLAGGVAHEINNPINSILNYAQLIVDEAPAESRDRQWAGEIIQESERVAGIVRNLLQFARRDSQRLAPARISDILTTTLGLIQSVLRKDQIRLEINVPETLPPILCRGQQIQQVFVNMLTNARDALNERYPEYHEDKCIRIGAETVEREGAPWVRVTVEDHGVGIAAEHLERIFDPFFTTKAREVNTGLGLSISHGIIKDHRGEITVESQPGRFTRFHLLFPSAENAG
jgi:PAS domain S-box-containing protein